MNIEIIPNWHPIFVHFTIGLLTISALFYLAGLIFKKDVFYTVGKWNLWIGVLITTGTVLAGLQAAGSVDHDAQSHAAMMNHRNWALGTASVFAVLAAWSGFKHRNATPPALFTVLLVLASGALAVTGYKGGELVYRHGTGVMSLPNTGSHDHSAHGHGSEDGDTQASSSQESSDGGSDVQENPEIDSSDSHDHSGHDH